MSIIIPNWNGAAFLDRCIAAALMSSAASGLETEILLVDDASPDGSGPASARRYPQVRFLQNKSNAGFGETINRGAREAAGDILVLINNDLVAREALVAELAGPLLKNEEVFGVSGKTVDWHSQAPNHLNMAAEWDGGCMRLTYADSQTVAPTMFLQGGCCAVRRSPFLELGGMCSVFAPGYWEDYDLSYLALKAGWKNLYNPRAVAHHLGKQSMVRAFGSGQVAMMLRRNRFLFHLVNLTDPPLLRSHLGRWPGCLARGFACAGPPRQEMKALVRAARQVGHVASERRRRLPLLRLTDREVLMAFRGHGRPAD
ncbi:MAG: glycosyltransferase [Candidatus Sumerlaeaceae bacterium]|nr:glycosyltransferase [Candidatus Sumerlaeaceae bacterium]